MKFNQALASALAITLTVAPLLHAEVKPPRTILTTYCGENEAAATERNRKITEVCLARVEGVDVQLVVIKSEDSKGRELPVQALPIVEKTLQKKKNQFATKKKFLMTMVSSETEGSGKYELLKIAKAQLTIDSGEVLTRETPKAIIGSDLNGTPFEVNELSPIYHTESLDIH